MGDLDAPSIRKMELTDMIYVENDGIISGMSLEELAPFTNRLDRDALLRLVMRLGAQVQYLQDHLQDLRDPNQVELPLHDAPP